MQLENIATPQEQSSPHRRYATLHRAMESGMASDQVMRELVEICLQLGHLDEAKRVHSSMPEGPAREWVTSRLARRGLIHHPRIRPSGPTNKSIEYEDDGEPSLAEHIADAVQFLCHAHMPAVALLTMLAFPIVVGLGGFLTAGGSIWLFAGLATLPGLCVLGVVGAMGRQIFLHATEGEEEIPPIPAPSEMIALAKRHLSDVGLVLGILVAPSLLLLWFDAPLVSSLPGLAIGMFLTPIALILRQIRGDIGALSPVAMLRGIGCTRGYVKITGAFWLAFAPAAIAFWTTLGHAVWLQIAITGPLAVLPTFAAARLLGTFTEVHRERLGLLLHPPQVTSSGKNGASKSPASAPAKPSPTFTGIKQPPSQPRAQATAPKPAATRPAGAPPAPAPRLPQAPSGIAQKAANATPQPAPLPKAEEDRPRPAPRSTPQQPARRIEGRAPTPQQARPQRPQAQRPQDPRPQAQQPRPQPGQRPAPPARQQQRPAAPARQRPQPAQSEQSRFDGPDLSNLPGARVISAEEREKLGAASRRK